jgi:MFS family permease
MLRESRELRALSAMTLVNTIGNGLLVTSVVLFFTREVGLSGGQVGLGLTIAGACGLLAGVPAGHLGDRRGPREVLGALMVAQGVATLSYVFVSSFAAFVVTASVVVTLMQAGSAVKQGLIAQVLPPRDRVRARAFLRAVTNAGFAVGSAVAGIGILVDTRGAYEALIAGDALTFVLAAALLAGVPHVAPQPRRAEGPQLIVLRDRPYVAVTALVAVLSLHASLLEVGLPLWIAHTEAPKVMVSVIFVINCLLVVAFSVRFAQGSDTVEGAARAAVRAALLLAVSCVVFVFAHGPGAIAASVILVVAAVIQVAGEMAQSASGWGLAYGLAPEDAQGQYQGLSSTALALSTTVGPLLMAGVVAAGTLGWLAYGAVFLVSGFATVPVAAWAQRRRPAQRPGVEVHPG